MRKIAVVMLVVLFGAYSFGEIVLESIDDEDGFIRSDEAGGEMDSIRIGGGESEGRTFVSILSFDTSSLSGLAITEAYIRLTLCDNNPIWGGDGQIGLGEDGWVNPDDECPWVDMSEYFGADSGLDWNENDEGDVEDRDYDPDLGAVHLDDEWGFDTLTGPGDQLFIYLNAEALAFLSSHDTVQIRIGTNDGPGSGDAWDYSALDFYDGGNGADSAALVVIPEPVTVLLFGLGSLLLRRRK